VKVGDLIRVKKTDWMDAPGFFLRVLSMNPNGGVHIIILSGPRIGQEHVICPSSDVREFEVFNNATW